MTIKGVLFDLDGTLLDTIAGLADAMNKVLDDWGYPTHTTQEYKMKVGKGIETLVRLSLPESRRDPTSVDEGVAAMRKRYAEDWPRTTHAYDGVHEMLQGLVARNVKLGILSNKPHRYTVEMVEQLLPDYPFVSVYGARDDVPIKPAPDAALEMARGLVLPPSQIAFVGDTHVDMETGLNAGMLPVGVLWGFRTAQELSDAGGRVLVARPADLLLLV